MEFFNGQKDDWYELSSSNGAGLPEYITSHIDWQIEGEQKETHNMLTKLKQTYEAQHTIVRPKLKAGYASTAGKHGSHVWYICPIRLVSPYDVL